MTWLNYAKRALAELSGGHTGKRNVDIKRYYPVIVAASAAVTLIIFGLIVWSLMPSGKTASESECVFRIPEPGSPAPAVPGDAVRLDTCVTLEKVATPSARTLGLSNRTSMPRDRGMLFDFKEPNKYCMWMKDMHFSLDMIWLNESHEIVAVEEDVAPQTYPDKTFCGPENARYVVEVNAGIVQAADLRMGQQLNL